MVVAVRLIDRRCARRGADSSCCNREENIMTWNNLIERTIWALLIALTLGGIIIA